MACEMSLYKKVCWIFAVLKNLCIIPYINHKEKHNVILLFLTQKKESQLREAAFSQREKVNKIKQKKLHMK